MKLIIQAWLVFTLVIFSHPHKAFAQSAEVDESFDPFSDYNDFEQETEEEADINFLKNGRYLTLALVGGYRGYTGGLSQAYTGNIDYGVQFNYFFDLNLALGFGYTTGDNDVAFNSYSGNGGIKTPYSGNVNIQIFDIHLKYYINTDNVTKGLADLNPYAIIGTGFFTRTYSLNYEVPADPDKVFGFRLGAGLEIPLVRRNFYLGFQAIYNYVQFPDENKNAIEEESSNDPYLISPLMNGDIFEIQTVLGVNF